MKREKCLLSGQSVKVTEPGGKKQWSHGESWHPKRIRVGAESLVLRIIIILQVSYLCLIFYSPSYNATHCRIHYALFKAAGRSNIGRFCTRDA